ncbi:unnamed protein product [Malus baccata var. baccata]
MSGSGGSEVRNSIFSGENYEFWRIKMVTIFKSHGLWNLVEKGVKTSDSKKNKSEGSSEDDGDEEMSAVLMQDAKALGIIQNAVSDQIFPRIANAESAKMAWDLLYGEYHGGDQVRSVKLQNLRREFEYARMRDDESLSSYLTRLNDLINQMRTFGESFTKCVLSITLVSVDTKGNQSVSTVINLGIGLESAIQLEMTGNLFYANNTVTEPKVNGEWYIDSGCSNHMTGNVDLLVEVRTNVAGKVQMPTGDLVNVAGMGSLVIDTNKGRKYVKEVMYLPGLKENLLSVGQMDEHGYFLVFGGGICNVYDGPSLECLVMRVKKKMNRCYPLTLFSEN